MAVCNYNGCKEGVYENGLCILHHEFPESENSNEFKSINKLKEKILQEKISKKDFNFEGVKLNEVNFREINIDNEININFKESQIRKNVKFDEVSLIGHVLFNKSEVNGNILFNNTNIKGEINFSNSKVQNVVFKGKKLTKSSIIFKNANILGQSLFKNAELGRIDFSFAKIINRVNFENVVVYGNVIYNGAKLNSDVWFDRFIIKKSISFEGVEIIGNIYFVDNMTYIGGDISFDNIFIDGDIAFNKIKINNDILSRWAQIGNMTFEDVDLGGNINLIYSKIRGHLLFNNGIIGKNVSLNRTEVGNNARFDNTKIDGKVHFNVFKVDGKLTFNNTHFKKLKTQENACRYAKNIWEKLGDRTETDRYFYYEMVSKRKQKEWYFKYLEILIQYCFGYGVRPERVIITWISIILIFAIIYSTQNGINGNLDYSSYFYSSVVTGITPGFGNYRPDGIYQLLASFEAIVGTFMWAAFIATFTRKYMR